MSLSGKTIVVTRGEKGSKEWVKSFTSLGATVYNLPTITMSPIVPNEIIISVLKSVDSFDWIIFTSASGVRYFINLYSEIGLARPDTFRARIAVIGTRTAAEVRKAGLNVAFEPSTSDSEHLSVELDPVNQKRLLLLRTTIASDDLPAAFKKRGAEVTDLRIYKTAVITNRDESFSTQLQAGKVDFITFASPSAVDGFMVRVTKDDQNLAKDLNVVAIGPSVVRALRHAGFKNVHMAKTASLEGVIDKLNQLAQ